MKLIDLDQTVIVPIVDEIQGGVEYEQQMTLAELFEKLLPDFQPVIVDAIPVKWIKQQPIYQTIAVRALIERWQKEQEAR